MACNRQIGRQIPCTTANSNLPNTETLAKNLGRDFRAPFGSRKSIVRGRASYGFALDIHRSLRPKRKVGDVAARGYGPNIGVTRSGPFTQNSSPRPNLAVFPSRAQTSEIKTRNGEPWTTAPPLTASFAGSQSR
jgi:hypothetical protein